MLNPEDPNIGLLSESPEKLVDTEIHRQHSGTLSLFLGSNTGVYFNYSLSLYIFKVLKTQRTS